MGYRANERGKLSEDFVAAGDGLVAFGAALILPVQTHCGAGRVAAGQWIYAKPCHAHRTRLADNQCSQIRSKSTGTRAVARGNLGPHPNTPTAASRPATAAAGERPCHPPPSPAPERRAAAAGRCTPRHSRGTLKDGLRRPKPCGVRQSLAVWPFSRPSPWSWTARADCHPLNKAPVGQRRVSRVPQRSQPLFVRCAGSSALQAARWLSRAKHLTKRLTWTLPAVENSSAG